MDDIRCSFASQIIMLQHNGWVRTTSPQRPTLKEQFREQAQPEQLTPPVSIPNGPNCCCCNGHRFLHHDKPLLFSSPQGIVEYYNACKKGN